MVRGNRRYRYDYCFRKRKYEGRIIKVGIIFSLIFIALIGRFTYLQVVKGQTLKAMADAQYFYEENISEKNYRVVDRNNKEFLEYDTRYFATIDTWAFFKFNKNIYDNEIIKSIRIYLKMREEELKELQENYQYSQEKKVYELDETTYNELKKLKDINTIKGFYTHPYSYAKNDYAWDIVNMIINEQDSRYGNLKSENSLEIKIKNITENNNYVKKRFSKDIKGELSEKTVNPSDNVNLRLTLDINVQDKIKEILNKEKYSKYGEIGVVLMEAKSGKVRAMVQKDDKLPNINIGAVSNHGYFPGSIFKVLVEEAALESNKISLNEEFRHKSEKNGAIEYVKIEEALRRSLNDVFYKVGERVGFNKIYELAKAQGLLDKVLNLHDEQRGYFENYNSKVKDLSIGQVHLTSIGQNLRITPLEAISIPNTVVNDGRYVKPHIIEALVDEKNNILVENKDKDKDKEEVEGVISKNTAKTLKKQMIEVVENGSGINAKLNDVIIGGKTGTTEYYEEVIKRELVEDNSNYSREVKEKKKLSDGWFVGFFNLDNKNYSMVVLVRNIDVNKEEAANTAVPIFKDIVKYLNDSKDLS